MKKVLFLFFTISCFIAAPSIAMESGLEDSAEVNPQFEMDTFAPVPRLDNTLEATESVEQSAALQSVLPYCYQKMRGSWNFCREVVRSITRPPARRRVLRVTVASMHLFAFFVDIQTAWDIYTISNNNYNPSLDSRDRAFLDFLDFLRLNYPFLALEAAGSFATFQNILDPGQDAGVGFDLLPSLWSLGAAGVISLGHQLFPKIPGIPPKNALSVLWTNIQLNTESQFLTRAVATALTVLYRGEIFLRIPVQQDELRTQEIQARPTVMIKKKKKTD